MKYNKNFSNYIMYMVFVIIFILLTFISMFSGLILSIIQNQFWTAETGMCMIIGIISIFLTLLFVVLSDKARLDWEIESDKENNK